MFMRDKIWQRRQKRMKQIMQSQYNGSDKQVNTWDEKPLQHERKPKMPNQVKDDKLHDPEFVWNMRQDQVNRNSADWEEWSQKPSSQQFIGKLLFCCLLFAAIWGLFQFQHPWALKSQNWIAKSLTEDYEFAQAAIWYENLFDGAPSFIPTFKKNKAAEEVDAQINRDFFKPVDGTIHSDYSIQTSGMELKTDLNAEVTSIDTGRVIFVGDRQATGLTVIVQHTQQLQSIYGMLADATVEINDWVTGGREIGIVSRVGKNGHMYFAVKQAEHYINPVDVIVFD